ncbi:MAG: DUF1571 domain-containing protein [Isosphaeraceae bacterium]|nr:DUF1571 domain-containing protein [Isosphaeraceae bacterium]
MDPAMDSAERNARGRRVPACLVLGMLAAAGCSNLHGTNQLPPPMLGTMRPEVMDPYLAHHNASGRHPGESAVPNEALVDATPTPASLGPDPTVRGLEPAVPQGELVGLGRPVSLPTPSNPAPEALASNDSGTSLRSTGLPPLAPPGRAPSPVDLGPATEASRTPALAAAPRDPAPSATKPTAPADSAETVVKNARRKLDAMKTYQVALHRQERVGGVLLPEEDVVLSVRRSPKAVRLEWPNGSSKGREVIYSASENGGLMHVNMPNAVVPIPRLSLPPDSPLVMKNSRHPITEAGFDNIVANLEGGLAVTTGPNRLVYAGIETPKEFGKPCHKLTRVGPKGERWVVYLDQSTGLPAIVEEKTPAGELQERYVFRDVKPNLPDLAVASAFDVNQRWGSGGFLSRLARAGAAADSGPPAAGVTR